MSPMKAAGFLGARLELRSISGCCHPAYWVFTPERAFPRDSSSRRAVRPMFVPYWSDRSLNAFGVFQSCHRNMEFLLAKKESTWGRTHPVFSESTKRFFDQVFEARSIGRQRGCRGKGRMIMIGIPACLGLRPTISVSCAATLGVRKRTARSFPDSQCD